MGSNLINGEIGGRVTWRERSRAMRELTRSIVGEKGASSSSSEGRVRPHPTIPTEKADSTSFQEELTRELSAHEVGWNSVGRWALLTKAPGASAQEAREVASGWTV